MRGMREEGVQKRLLTKTYLTFAKVREKAEIAERAAKNTEQLQSVTILTRSTSSGGITKEGKTVRPSGLLQVWRSA